MNAILYVLCQGCTWRALPGDFPPWSTVYGYFRLGRLDGTWLLVHDKLYQWVRVAGGREPSPSVVAVDSQSVESATMINQDVGYDAGKQIHGRFPASDSGYVRSGFTSLSHLSFPNRTSGSQACPGPSSWHGKSGAAIAHPMEWTADTEGKSLVGG